MSWDSVVKPTFAAAAVNVATPLKSSTKVGLWCRTIRGGPRTPGQASGPRRWPSTGHPVPSKRGDSAHRPSRVTPLPLADGSAVRCHDFKVSTTLDEADASAGASAEASTGALAGPAGRPLPVRPVSAGGVVSSEAAVVMVISSTLSRSPRSRQCQYCR
jgi:hypothetical protein